MGEEGEDEDGWMWRRKKKKRRRRRLKEEGIIDVFVVGSWMLRDAIKDYSVV